MLELAPQRKQGLTLTSPIIAASGSVGFANEADALIARAQFGAIVTAPISLRPRSGAAQPRLVELRGGVLLNHGDHNRGWQRAVEKFGAIWMRHPTPFIVQLAGQSNEWVELARHIEHTNGIAGIEVDVESAALASTLAAIRAAVELPILARLPYGGDVFAAQVVAAGADALVCIMPPRGAALDGERQQLIEGLVYGPLVKPLALQTLQAVRQSGLTIPLIGCGGVHTRADVTDFLTAGANAVMIDSLVWVNPQAVNDILQTW